MAIVRWLRLAGLLQTTMRVIVCIIYKSKSIKNQSDQRNHFRSLSVRNIVVTDPGTLSDALTHTLRFDSFNIVQIDVFR